MADVAQSDPRVAQVCDLLDQLAHDESGATLAQPGDDLDRLLANAKTVAAELAELRAYAARATWSMNELTEVIVALVSFDYSRKVPISDKDDIFDGVAGGLNMLGETLSLSTVSRAFVESMPDALIVLDDEGVIKSLNQAACDMSLYPREHLLGQSLPYLFEGVEGPALIAQGGVKNQEMTCRMRKGDGTPVSFSASIMRDLAGRVQGVVCVARDLTEVKQVEAERQRFQDAARRQAILVEELSTPIIPVADEILVLPLIGSIDHQRSERMTQALLDGIAKVGARVAIMDITGVRAINVESVQGVIRAVQAARLVGAEMVLTGIRTGVAVTLVEIGADLGGVMTFSTLRDGIAYAIRRVRGQGR